MTPSLPDPATPDPKHPVEYIETDDPRRPLEPGVALCLSGGGYRAMLFHVGALWRLYELDLLRSLRRISSVSGGSITAALLGLRWKRLSFDPRKLERDFVPQIVAPLRAFARRTVDLCAVAGGLVLPWSSSDLLAVGYRHYLFGGATLQDLPNDPPRFVINATNVQSGALWRFAKPYMRDWRVGEVKRPRISLAAAVAASTAFPPVLSPAILPLEPTAFTPASGYDLQCEPFTSRALLTDGGVYDNLGLETVWKRYQTVLASDAGGSLEPEEAPSRDWPRHTVRVVELIDNQVRRLRKRQLIDSFTDGTRSGAYWGIRSNIAKYALPDALDCPEDETLELARVPTRLQCLDDRTQERLINWGYAVCDAAIRRHVAPGRPAPRCFPYPDVPVG